MQEKLEKSSSLFSKYYVLSSGYQYEGAGDSMSLNFIPVRRTKRCERSQNLHEIAAFHICPTYPKEVQGYFSLGQ